MLSVQDTTQIRNMAQAGMLQFRGREQFDKAQIGVQKAKKGLRDIRRRLYAKRLEAQRIMKHEMEQARSAMAQGELRRQGSLENVGETAVIPVAKAPARQNIGELRKKAAQAADHSRPLFSMSPKKGDKGKGSSTMSHLLAFQQTFLKPGSDNSEMMQQLKKYMTREKTLRLKFHKSSITALELQTPQLMTGDTDGLVVIWDIYAKEPLRVIETKVGSTIRAGSLDSQNHPAANSQRSCFAPHRCMYTIRG